MLVAAAILSEFTGPDAAREQFGGFINVTKVEWVNIKDQFPRSEYAEFVKTLNLELCRRKPVTTYDNAVDD